MCVCIFTSSLSIFGKWKPHIASFWLNHVMLCYLVYVSWYGSVTSTDKNVQIIRSNIVIVVQTPTPSLFV